MIFKRNISTELLPININMRCIEIYIRRELEEYKCVININMRCIEMVKN